MPRFVIPLVTLLAFASLSPAGTVISPSSAPAATTTAPSEQKTPVQFPLSQAKPLEHFDGSPAEIAKRFSDFVIDPSKGIDVNPFVLPFRYESTGGQGDPNEALAFSFLLSNVLDWIPGNYCARHAYFVFKSDKKGLKDISNWYNKEDIAFRVSHWQATHAVGGTLVASVKGFSGTLEIYEASGEIALTKDFKAPREYFDLLGDMAAEAMRHFDFQPTEALITHIKTKRASQESLLELGQAAHTELRGYDTFQLYGSILARDPDFSEVRYWYANQKNWADGNNKRKHDRIFQSLKSYLVPSALAEFNPNRIESPTVKEDYLHWLDEYDRLVGSDSPEALRFRIWFLMSDDKPVPDSLVKRAIASLRKYPNSYWLAVRIGRVYFKRESPDYDKAVACFATALASNYLTGSYDNSTPWNLACSLSELGHNAPAASMFRQAISMAKKGREHEDTLELTRGLAFVLMQMGRYDEAIKYQRKYFKAMDADSAKRNRILTQAGTSAALAGRLDILDQILQGRSAEVASTGMKPLLEAYRRAAAGEKVDARKLWQTARKGLGFWQRRALMALCCQLTLMRSDGEDFRRKADELVFVQPMRREWWIILDAYDRLSPRPSSAGFYDALEWLQGEDTWVVDAAADFRKRVTSPELMSYEQADKLLSEFEQVASAGDEDVTLEAAWSLLHKTPVLSFTAICRQLCDKGRFDEAEELAVRYAALGKAAQSVDIVTHATRTLSKISAAKDAAAAISK